MAASIQITLHCIATNFQDGDVKKIAKWSDLIQLYNLEKDHTVKLSKLSDVAIFPKPVERQKVSMCLQVFCDETINALKPHPGVVNGDDTISYVNKFVKFWKIMNVKGLLADIRFRGPGRAVTSSHDDCRLNYLLEIVNMAEGMMTEKQGKRQQQLTKDTARALSHTCRSIVDLTKYLLSSTHSYVILSQFSTDLLEKSFGKLRQGSGGTYFITVQQVLEKVKIQRAK